MFNLPSKSILEESKGGFVLNMRLLLIFWIEIPNCAGQNRERCSFLNIMKLNRNIIVHRAKDGGVFSRRRQINY